MKDMVSWETGVLAPSSREKNCIKGIHDVAENAQLFVCWVSVVGLPDFTLTPLQFLVSKEARVILSK